MKLFFLLLFFLSMETIGFSQNKKIDSIYSELKKSNHDSSKISLLQNLGDEYEFINYDSAIYWYNKALRISENNLKSKTNHQSIYENLKANTIKSIGIIYYYQGNYEKAIVSYAKALALFTELKKPLSIASCYTNIGVIHQEQFRYDEAMKYYLKALNIFEKLNNLKGSATCNMNLGNLFSLQQNFKKAEEYYLKSIEVFSKIKDEYSIATCYNNLGGIYSEQQMMDKSIEFYKKALVLKTKFNDKLGIADIYNNMGNVLFGMHKVDESYECYKMSLDIGLDFENNSVISNCYVSLAKIMLERNKIKEAIEFAEKGLKYARSENLLEQITYAYFHLSDAYESIGDFKKALFYKKKFIYAKDSMISTERNKLVTEMDSKYQSEKKQQQIIIQTAQLGKKEAEIKQQQTKLVAFISGFFLVLFLLGFAIYNFRQKRKANILLSFQNSEIQQKNEEITSQRDEIEAQRDKLSLQNEMLAEQQEEITDSITYAKRIQEAVLPDFEQLFNTGKQYSVSSTQNTAYRLPLTAYFILFKPKDIVSGDFYWATQINEWLIVTVADCTGHGVPGAFMSMLGISFLNEIVRKKEILSASDILNQLRTTVIDALKQYGKTGEQKDGMDMALCVINFKTLEMQYAGANSPCWIVNSRQSVVESPQSTGSLQLPTYPTGRQIANSQLLELKPDKMPVAIYDNMNPFTNQIIQLNKGDIIYLKSDGYEDQYAWPSHKKFLSKNLKKLLLENSIKTMEEQKEILNRTIDHWKNGQEQIDDITILGIKI